MKHIFTYIVLILYLFKSCLALASTELPPDFEGVRTKALLELQENEVFYSPTMAEVASIALEIGKYFNDKYPDNEVYTKNLTEELRPFFPNANLDELEKKNNTLRTGIRLYRLGLQIYNKYITKKMVPHTYRQVHSEDDFNHEGEVGYIQAPEGKFTKVYNFKKFLTYSNDPDERKAIRDYVNLHNPNATLLEKMDYALRRIEWKKILLYGVKYKNPLLSDLGLSGTQKGINVEARLISNSTYIDGKTEIEVGIEIITKDNTFVLANNLSPTLQKPKITFQKNDNIEDYSVYYPVPHNSISYPHAHKYFGDFLIPLKFKIKDPTQTLNLTGSIRLVTCNKMDCIPENFTFNLTIDPNGPDFFTNGFSNFFYINTSNLPQNTATKFELTKFVIDKAEDKQSLRLEFAAREKPENFKIFIEEKDGYTPFSAPLISMQDDHIYVRFETLENTDDLVDSEFIITAVFNNQERYRTTRIAKAGNLFDPNKPTLNLALIFFALLGGLILNFMPCVFPVLSLKLITLCQTRYGKNKNLKQSLLMTVCGIFSGFTFIILMLISAKYLGYSLGWGIQFQNVEFLVVMSFILTGFIALLPYFDLGKIQRFSNSRTNHKINFLIGNLVVLLSTPCTGPYLATAIGFALTGTYVDIITIMYAVAFGLSSPYLLALCLEQPQTLLPPAGPWLSKLQCFMKIMLYLTIIWFFSLIRGQTDWRTVILLIIALIIFTLAIKLHQKFTEYLSVTIFDEKIKPQILNKLRRSSNIALITLFILLASGSSLTARRAYLENYQQNISSRATLIDKSMILEKLNSGKSVLLEIGADWCLTCHFNNTRILNNSNLKRWKKSYNMELIRIDWTNYDKQVLNFMEQYGRKGLPFYILYTPILRDGIVLPEIFSSEDFENIISNAVTD